MSVAAGSFREAFTVRSYEATSRARVSVQSICNYLQEAAGNHARGLGLSIEQLARDNLTWVLGMLRLELGDVPAWRDTLEVETWPSGDNGVVATRDFLLRAGEREFGRATSAWFVLDVNRRRPVRLPPSIRGIGLPDRDPVLRHDFPTIAMPEKFAHEVEFRVRYSDLDMNQHVNNVRYVEWSIEGIPRNLTESRNLCELEVHFKSETVAGERIRVQTAPIDDARDGSAFVHRLTISGIDREVALVKSRWTERDSG